MTREQAAIVAFSLNEELFGDVIPERSDSGVGNPHLRWMCLEIVRGQDEAKTMRWLGYIQGVLVATGRATLDDMKDLNERVSAAG